MADDDDDNAYSDVTAPSATIVCGDSDQSLTELEDEPVVGGSGADAAVAAYVAPADDWAMERSHKRREKSKREQSVAA